MKRGFTLIEVVIVVGIYAITILGLVNLFFIFNSLYGYQQAFISAAGSAGGAMNALEAAVLPANQVLASHSFSGTTYSSATSTLVLELPTVDSSGDIVAGAKDYIVFYASSTALYQLIQTDASSMRQSGLKQLSGTLQSVTFTYDNSDFTQVAAVTADIQTQAQSKEQVVQSHLREQLFLRNL